MGTRGVLGFRAEERDILTYNHSDSYPDWLGRKVVDWLGRAIAQQALPEAKAKALALLPVEEDKAPSPAQIEALAPYTNLSVSERSTADWYCLLRDTQGDAEAILRAGYYEPADGFIMDSLFCEYAYIVNFDDAILEVYQGFQKQRGVGRYAEAQKRKPKPNYAGGPIYWPVTLALCVPFAEINHNRVDDVVAAMNKATATEDETLHPATLIYRASEEEAV